MSRHRRRAYEVGTLIAAFLAADLLLGILLFGLLAPAAGMAAVMQDGRALYDALPDRFEPVVPKRPTTLLASDGKTVLATLSDENRVVVDLKDISPWMLKAQVSIEDRRFYEHNGVDVKGIGAALAGVVLGREARGASTLTQQYVKVSLQTAAIRRGDDEAAKAATAVSLTRKLQEIRYATSLEKTLTKDEILRNYLNLVYFGDQAYGVEAAARHYFDTPASKLTLTQAATLAGLVQQPGGRDPIHNPDGARARRNEVLAAMLRDGHIDKRTYRTATRSPLTVRVGALPKRTCAESAEPFWCSYVLEWLAEQPALGRDRRERVDRITAGGYRIVTTLDPALQKESRRAMGRVISAEDYPRYGSAAVTVETSTGKIRSMVQSAEYATDSEAAPGKTQVNWAVDQRYGGSGGFSVGSNMKLFTIVEALRQGLGVDHTITGIRPEHTKWYPEEFQRGCTVGTGWPVKNAEGTTSSPTMSLRAATAHSVNTAFVALASHIGTCNIRNTALAMGMHTATGTDPTSTDGQPLSQAAPLILLGSDASPATMAQMYASIANDGTSCPNRPIESVTDDAGKAVPPRLAPCTRVLTPSVARQTAELLRSVMTEGSGRSLQIGRGEFGKTGTDENNETWFTGATSHYTTSVWAGTPDENQLDWNHPTLHRHNGSAYTTSASGARIPGPIWEGIMRAAHRLDRGVDR